MVVVYRSLIYTIYFEKWLNPIMLHLNQTINKWYQNQSRSVLDGGQIRLNVRILKMDFLMWVDYGIFKLISHKIRIEIRSSLLLGIVYRSSSWIDYFLKKWLFPLYCTWPLHYKIYELCSNPKISQYLEREICLR